MEPVNHPAHYGGEDNPYEAIKVIEAHKLNFNLGNTLKYILRADHKGKRVEDLKKALWFLNREIENSERQEKLTLAEFQKIIDKAASAPAQPMVPESSDESLEKLADELEQEGLVLAHARRIVETALPPEYSGHHDFSDDPLYEGCGETLANRLRAEDAGSSAT